MKTFNSFLLVWPLILFVLAFPATAQPAVTGKCVAKSSDLKHWVACDGEDEVIWEPPRIRWITPSIEGATSSPLHNTDATFNKALGQHTETSYILIQQAQAALERGEYDAAERLFFAAGLKDPDDRDKRDIKAGLQTTRELRLAHFRGVVLFDQKGPNASPIPKFVKSAPQDIAVEIPAKLQDNPKIRRLLKEETDAYSDFRVVADKLRRLYLDKEAGRASQAQFNSATAEYSRAAEKVAAKRSEILQKVSEGTESAD
jgi:hypothetical protein